MTATTRFTGRVPDAFYADSQPRVLGSAEAHKILRSAYDEAWAALVTATPEARIKAYRRAKKDCKNLRYSGFPVPGCVADGYAMAAYDLIKGNERSYE